MTRLPFLFYGYGSEEDAWGLIVTARNILQTGTYEVSRLPGHPLQEILLIPGHLLPSWILNMATAMVSTVGVVFFVKTLKSLGIDHYIFAGVALAFTPVFYIQSTTVMDYTWALSFCLISFHQLVHRRYLMAGILIAVATGFRITSAAMLLPMLYLNQSLLGNRVAGKEALILILSTCCGSFIMFLPPLVTYGPSFFTFYQYFPYPELSRILYKAFIGVWGLPGSLLIFSLMIPVMRKMKCEWRNKQKQTLSVFCMLVITLYMISFIRIPQKSAFIIPMLPWIFMLFVLYLNRNRLRILVAGLFISCFFFGLNLDHPLRGSDRSFLSAGVGTGSVPVAFDVIYGPLVADVQKRKNKMDYARVVAEEVIRSQEKILLIAGWYQNEIVYRTGSFSSGNWKIIYYGDAPELHEHIEKGYKVYYLPEQETFNDLRYNKKFTKEIASPFRL